jgi:D-tyrosyl-tRNA(Tyr) deacylase
MRLLIQRVSEARVDVDGKTIGAIQKGALVLFGAHEDDKPSQVTWLANKLINLRIFMDEQEKMNLSLLDIKGSILIVSQFTLYGECNAGRRPSFIHAARPELARSLYDSFVMEVSKSGLPVETGEFGAMMQVHLVNDGPVTLLVDAPN